MMRSLLGRLVVILAVLASASLLDRPAFAQQAGVQPPAAAVAAGRTPLPVIAKGKGDKCVEPTDWMRRNHMRALMHKRDETMYEGDRTAKHSLKECVSCHAVPGSDGRPVTVADPKHFCRTCHDYAAVKVDCFECHASRPEQGKPAAAANGSREASGDVAVLHRYLEGVSR